MVVSCETMRRIEEAAFERGVSAEALMAQAGLALARTVHQLSPRPGHAVAYLGKGNNAGDALVALRHLEEWGWKIEARLSYPPDQFSPLALKQWEAIRFVLKSKLAATSSVRRTVQLDGLVGIGAKGSLRDPLDAAARAMNLERQRGAITVAVDLPSGLDGDTGFAWEPTVVADWTVTFGAPKMGLLADFAANCVGRLAVVPLEGLDVCGGDPSIAVNTPSTLKPILKRRAFDTHKSMAGRVGVFGGSRGYTGAPLMSASGAVQGGAGLITLFADESVYEILATRAPVEVMVHPVHSLEDAAKMNSIDVFAVGPGLGRKYDEPLRQWIRDEPRPMVIDADALNALAQDSSILEQAAGPRLLTPHPGEFARLFPDKPPDRLGSARAFLSRFPRVTLLLKGARTLVADASHASYNTTGNPGMATGGMGDVLTGVLGALVSQKYSLTESARLGSWVCGRAAELAVAAGESEESLSPTHVLNYLGRAFSELRDGAGGH